MDRAGEESITLTAPAVTHRCSFTEYTSEHISLYLIDCTN